MSDQAADALRRQLEEDVRAAEAERQRYLGELGATAGRGEGARAAAPAGEDSSPMTVLRDTSLPAERRVEVLDRLGAQLSRRAEYVPALLAIAKDRSDDPAVRYRALEALRAAAFGVRRFKPHERAYEQVLRTLVTDDDARLREMAVETLALRHDAEVQQVLLAGLRGDGPLPVPRERAIQLLAEDDHLDNLPWLHELYRSESDDARQEAVRLMSSYADARDTLEGILRDRNEVTQVRQQSAASLRHLAPERFEAVSKEIAVDGGDYPEIRALSLNALRHLGDRDRVAGDTAFVERLQRVSDEESAPEVAHVARRLLEQLPDKR
jgi:hypothetical protein